MFRLLLEYHIYHGIIITSDSQTIFYGPNHVLFHLDFYLQVSFRKYKKSASCKDKRLQFNDPGTNLCESLGAS